MGVDLLKASSRRPGLRGSGCRSSRAGDGWPASIRRPLPRLCVRAASSSASSCSATRFTGPMRSRSAVRRSSVAAWSSASRGSSGSKLSFSGRRCGTHSNLSTVCAGELGAARLLRLGARGSGGAALARFGGAFVRRDTCEPAATRASSASRSPAVASPIRSLALVDCPLQLGDLIVEAAGSSRRSARSAVAASAAPRRAARRCSASLWRLRHSACSRAAALSRSRSAAVSRALVAASARFSATAEAAVAATSARGLDVLLQRRRIGQGGQRILGRARPLRWPRRAPDRDPPDVGPGARRCASIRSSAAAAESIARAASRASRSAASAACRACSASARHCSIAASARRARLVAHSRPPAPAPAVPRPDRRAGWRATIAPPPPRPTPPPRTRPSAEAARRESPAADRRRAAGRRPRRRPRPASGGASARPARSHDRRGIRAGGQLGIVGLRFAALPPACALAADRRVGILAQRRGERAFVARARPQAAIAAPPPCSSARASASCSRLARRKRRARGGELALRRVARARRPPRVPARPSTRRASASAERLAPHRRFRLGFRPRAFLLAPVAQRLQLLGKLLRAPARSAPSCARAASSAASATRRSARIAACRASNSASAASASRETASALLSSPAIRADRASESASRCSIAARSSSSCGNGAARRRLSALFRARCPPSSEASSRSSSASRRATVSRRARAAAKWCASCVALLAQLGERVALRRPARHWRAPAPPARSAIACWMRSTSSAAARASAVAASAASSASRQRACSSRASTPRIWSVSLR